ncbi:hypothetical protein LZ554_007487 [Drepanopeziza brunnea f. sp. 'monogermtubi']|nr:hypothetical protein LZ554_007487 [Drepanopeziza brunnea f. sp. 'monogermtubi']
MQVQIQIDANDLDDYDYGRQQANLQSGAQSPRLLRCSSSSTYRACFPSAWFWLGSALLFSAQSGQYLGIRMVHILYTSTPVYIFRVPLVVVVHSVRLISGYLNVVDRPGFVAGYNITYAVLSQHPQQSARGLLRPQVPVSYDCASVRMCEWRRKIAESPARNWQRIRRQAETTEVSVGESPSFLQYLLSSDAVAMAVRTWYRVEYGTYLPVFPGLFKEWPTPAEVLPSQVQSN